MHEWALAESVLETVKESMKEQQNDQIESVELLFGELQAVDEEVFREGLKSLLETVPEGEKLPLTEDIFTIETEKASFTCNNCGTSWDLDSITGLGEYEREAIHFMPEAAHSYMSCPHCSSADYRVDQGRGVAIKSIVFRT